MGEDVMTRSIRRPVLLILAFLGGVLLLGQHPAMAQGPYGLNSYEDFPYNQGSLFYRPLKPKPKPKVRVVQRPVNPAPAPGGYTYTYSQPNTYAAPRGGYAASPAQPYVQRYTNVPQPYYYYPA